MKVIREKQPIETEIIETDIDTLSIQTLIALRASRHNQHII
jgi:hypothetical protein